MPGEERILKGPPRVTPNLLDDDPTRAAFTWDDARRLLDGLPGGRGQNLAHECVDRHVAGPRRDQLALRFLGKDGAVLDVTFADLAERSSRFANVLASLGVGKGERVFTLLGRVPQLYVAALGTWKNVSVFCPLFSAFGPEPVATRLRIGDARVLVTSTKLYAKKVAPIRGELPLLEHVLLVDADSAAGEGCAGLERLLADASPSFVIPPTSPDDMALLHFTSGTTGTPKGAIHVHGAAAVHVVTGRTALDLHDDDVYWCTADPGWVTGTSYGIIAPLACGVRTIVDEGEIDIERWYRTLEEQHVTVWYTAPTAVRRMMRAGVELAAHHRFESLRFIGSVGEPLNPEAVRFGVAAFQQPIHDNWWQTETGGIMIANTAAMAVKPGSMGKPLPGVEAAVVERTAAGGVRVIDEPEREGELALRPGWPSMFRGYLHEEERYRSCFAGGFYLTGDLVKRDADGYYWFVGRADDVIKTSGHLVGPFEVESALMEHPDVVEAAVIGKPDPVAGAIIKAFVVVRAGVEHSESERMAVLAFARASLGPAVAPKELALVDDLPKTRSGKIMRRLLKARELGLPEGDLSSLEGSL